ncbi:hypothetical protein [Rodentibacter myodis]|uniref:hypothetical protein n=1 Tax=Rodentibacter myodis TaxID=1907939 RepID=UPI001FC95901|nr:hypothetical protein [Rodentibacter myodis]
MSSIKSLHVEMMKNYHSEQIDRVADMCRADVMIYHYDTLRTPNNPRRLPDGIEVTVFDESGTPFPAKIEEGKSVHYGVRCGYISWQLSGGKAASSTYIKPFDRRNGTYAI